MNAIVEGTLLIAGSSFVGSVVVKATITLAAVLGGARVARRGRASVRHAILVAGFAALVALPVAATVGPSLTLQLPPAAFVPQPATTAPADTAPFGVDDGRTTDAQSDQSSGGPQSAIGWLATVWAAGAFVGALPIVLGLWQVNRLRRSSRRWPDGDAILRALVGNRGGRIQVMLSDSVAGPITFGILRPAIILPHDARVWGDADLERAIVHELEHVHRADWLHQAIAAVVCAAYWFHPLVWVARRQLVTEAERACDDAVVVRFEAGAYAEQLLTLAERLGTAAPHRTLGMANHDLRARLNAVLDNTQARGRAGRRAVATVTVAMTVAVAAVAPLRTSAGTAAVEPVAAIGDISTPLAPVEAPRRSTTPVAPATPLSATRAPAPISQASAVASAPQVEESTVASCSTGNGARRGGPGGAASSADLRTIGLNCGSIAALIRRANGYGELSGVPVEGGPAWAYSDEYAVRITASVSRPMSETLGPMLRSALERHFRLQLRRETRTVPAYALTIGPAGHRLVDGVCEPPRRPPVPNLPPPESACGFTRVIGPSAMTARYLPMDDIAAMLRELVGRPVINATGLAGYYDARLQFAARAAAPVADALREQLGLELETTTAPTDVFVIDHVERPTEK